MPKISAPTVAEHRRAQHRALLTAGEELLLANGVTGATPKSVCERAGLARTSFYAYFPSKDDLLTAIALQAFASWNTELSAVLAATPPGRPQLHAYVRATMQMTADGKHQLASVLKREHLTPTHYEDLMALHDQLFAPLLDILTDLGVPDPHTQTALTLGLLNSGVDLVTRGTSATVVAADIIAIIDTGIHPGGTPE